MRSAFSLLPVACGGAPCLRCGYPGLHGERRGGISCSLPPFLMSCSSLLCCHRFFYRAVYMLQRWLTNVLQGSGVGISGCFAASLLQFPEDQVILSKRAEVLFILYRCHLY